MADIKNTLSLTDNFTPVIRSTINALNSTLQAMRKIRGFKMSNDFKEASMAVKMAEESLQSFNQDLINTRLAQNQVGNVFSAMSVALGGFAYQAMDYVAQLPSKIINTGDALKGIDARLKFINDGTKTNSELFNDIFLSAQRARAEFGAVADVVASLGMLAKESFSSNDEMVSFVETLNKAFVVSGAGETEKTSAMYQLSQAMASGKLQGDEFRSIMENAPLLAQAIADFTGKSKAELKEMSAEGTITADVIKGAVFKASAEINRQFEEMPMTVGQALTITGNLFQNLFGDKMIGVSNALASTIMFINDHLYEFGIAIAYAGTVSAIMFAPAIWSIASGAAVAAFNFALMNAPLLIGVGLAFLLAKLFLQVPEALGYIVGGISAVGAMMYNSLIAPVKLFIDMLNVAIEAYNSITGKNIEMVENFDFVQMDDAFKNGYNAGNEFAVEANKKIDSLKSSLAGITDTKVNPLGITPENGNVPVNVKGGKLDAVKVNSEELKYLRDVATQQYKISYRQVTPQVNIAFGDVHETADVNVILDQIEQKMDEIHERDLKGA